MLFFYPGTLARNPNHSFFYYRHANGKLDRLESELVLQSRGTFRYGGRAIISLEGEVRSGRPDGHSPGARGIFRATVGLGQGSGRVARGGTWRLLTSILLLVGRQSGEPDCVRVRRQCRSCSAFHEWWKRRKCDRNPFEWQFHADEPNFAGESASVLAF